MQPTATRKPGVSLRCAMYGLGAGLVTWGVLALAVYVVWQLSGCVQARYRTGESDTTQPDGTKIHEKHREANYLDNRSGAAMAAGALDSIDWSALMKNPLVWAGGASMLGALGYGKHLHGIKHQSIGRNQMRAAQNRRAA